MLGTMPVVVEAGRAQLPWVNAILAKEAVLANKLESIEVVPTVG